MLVTTSAAIPIEVLAVFPNLGRRGEVERLLREGLKGFRACPDFCGVYSCVAFPIEEELSLDPLASWNAMGLRFWLLFCAYNAKHAEIDAMCELFAPLRSPRRRRVRASSVPALVLHYSGL